MMCSEYRKLIVQIAENIPIRDGSLSNFKFLCRDYIGEGVLAEIETPLALFLELENRSVIGADQLAFLREILQNTYFYKLDKLVEKFELSRDLHKLCLESQSRNQQCLVHILHKGDVQSDGNGQEVKFSNKGLVDRTSDDENLCQKLNPSSVQPNGFHQHHCCNCIQLREKCPERLPGEIHMKIVLEIATKGAWLAGTGFILNRYIEEPKILAGLFATVVLPAGVLVKYLCQGSIVCVLIVSELPAIGRMWQDYKQGLLKENLERVLITKELQDLAGGGEILLSVEIDEQDYRDVCMELTTASSKVAQVKRNLTKRSRRFSEPNLSSLCDDKTLEVLPSNVLVESLRINLTRERKMRINLEKDVERLREISQPLPIDLAALNRLWANDKESDDPSESSSIFTSASLDEDDVLQWEDEDFQSQQFWKRIEGKRNEKSWREFEKSVKREFPIEALLAKGMLLNFLAYVLKVKTADPDNSFVSIDQFVRLIKWFGPFCRDSNGCFQKMYNLMKGSVGRDSNGKFTSWFAGYLTDQEAREKLESDTNSTFLVRFGTQRCEFILTSKTPEGEIFDYFIKVDRYTGEVLYQDQSYADLPSLVNGLRKEGLLKLYNPFFSIDAEKIIESQK